MVDECDGSFLGLAALVEIDAAARQAEAGYIVAPAARGRGVAARALRLLTEWAFAALELERLDFASPSTTRRQSALPSDAASPARAS